MPSFSYQALKQTFGANNAIASVSYVEIKITSNNENIGITYAIHPDYMPKAGREFAEVSVELNDVFTIEIDGVDTTSINTDFEIGNVNWQENNSDLLTLRLEGADETYNVVFAGTPFPIFQSPSELQNFVNTVESDGPDVTGPFAENTFIPLRMTDNVVIDQSEGLPSPEGPRSDTGTDGADVFSNLAADQMFDGGGGSDTVAFSGAQSLYTLRLTADAVTIEDRSGADGTDTLSSIETLNFASGAFNLDQFDGLVSVPQGDLQSFVELYIAYFNRAPDAVGLSFWGTAFANGTSLSEMATLFVDQVETREAYPDTLSTADFATTVYNNVLGRVPDQIGFDFWVGVLDEGAVGRDQFILSVLEGAKAAPTIEATSEFIIQQLTDRAYLSNKTDIGAYFSVTQGMSNVESAIEVMQLFDGTQSGIDAAIAASDAFLLAAEASDTGEFLMPIIGVLDDPIA